jgi:hypothetical protein
MCCWAAWANAGSGRAQVGPNQVGPNQVGPNQVGPNQVGPNQVGPKPGACHPAFVTYSLSLLVPRVTGRCTKPGMAAGPPAGG